MSKHEEYGDVVSTYDETIAKNDLIRLTHERIDEVFEHYKLDRQDFIFEFYHFEENHFPKSDGTMMKLPIKSNSTKTLYCIAWKGTRKVVTEDMLSPEGEYEKFLMDMKG
jgi:hypothetical protein